MESSLPIDDQQIHIGSAATSQNRIDRLLTIVETGQTAQMRLEAGEQLAEICTMRSDTLPQISQKLLSMLCRIQKPPVSAKAPTASSWEVREASAAALGYLGPLWNNISSTAFSSTISDSLPEKAQSNNSEPKHEQEQGSDKWQAKLDWYRTSFDIIALLQSGVKLVFSAGTEYEVDEEDESGLVGDRKRRRLLAARVEVQRATGGGLGIGIPDAPSLPTDWLAEEDLVSTTTSASASKKTRRKEQPIHISVPHSIDDVICILALDLLHHERWTVRHGAVLGLAALSPFLTECDDILEFIGFRLLHLITIESFNDFVGERTIAPVREAAASLLSAILIRYPSKSILEGILLLMQSSIPWNARHASFLVAKALLINQKDACDPRIISMLSFSIINDENDDEDISLVAMEAFLAIFESKSPFKIDDMAITALTKALIRRLLEDTENLSPSTAIEMQLLAILLQRSNTSMTIDMKSGALSLRLLYFLCHPARSVRYAALQTLEALLIPQQNMVHKTHSVVTFTGNGTTNENKHDTKEHQNMPKVLQALFQSVLLEDDTELREFIECLWDKLSSVYSYDFGLVEGCQKLLLHHPLLPYNREAFPWASSSNLGFSHADLATLSVIPGDEEMEGKEETKLNEKETVLFPRFLNKWAAAKMLGKLISGKLDEPTLITLFPYINKIVGAFKAIASTWVIIHTRHKWTKEFCTFLYEHVLLPLSTDAVIFWEEEHDLITAIQRHLKIECTSSGFTIPLLLKDIKEESSAVITLATSLRTLHEQLRLQTWAAVATLFVHLMTPDVGTFALNPILRPMVTWLRMEDGLVSKLLLFAPLKQEVANALVRVVQMLLSSAGCFAVRDSAAAACKAISNVLAVEDAVIENESSGEDFSMASKLPLSLARCIHIVDALISVEDASEKWLAWVHQVLFPASLSPLRRMQLVWLIMLLSRCRHHSVQIVPISLDNTSKDFLNIQRVSDEFMAVMLLVNGIEVLRLPTDLPLFDLTAKPSAFLGQWCARALAVAIGHLPTLPASLLHMFSLDSSTKVPQSRTDTKNIEKQSSGSNMEVHSQVCKRVEVEDIFIVSLLGQGPLSLLHGLKETEIDEALIYARLEAIYEIFCAQFSSSCSKYLPLLAFHLIPLLSSSKEIIRTTASRCFAVVVQGASIMLSNNRKVEIPEALRERHSKALKMLDALFRPSAIPPFELPLRFGSSENCNDEFVLRPYQREGIAWLAFLARAGLHGILADDMGLGKTIQMLAVIASGATGALPSGGPSLIVAPPSLMLHWKGECERLTGAYLQPLLYHGPSRCRLLSTIRSHKGDKPNLEHITAGKSATSSKDLLIITSYDVIRTDISELEQIQWCWVVLDEGHAIRNRRSKTTMAVKRLRGAHRIILSGTPVQNNLSELWSLFDFIMPGYLGQNHAQFMAQHGGRHVAAAAATSNAARKAVLRRSAEALERLHRATNPFMLRRMKEDVLQDLPPKIILDVFVDLSEQQKQLYDRTLREDEQISAYPFATLRKLLRCCTVPALVEAQVTDSPKMAALQDLLLSCGIINDAEEDTLDLRQMHTASRALIIFQSVQTLEWIEQQLFVAHGISFLRLDGNVAAHERQKVVDAFNNDRTICALLMTIGVGGEGLTLTGADTVIFMECDWNPTRDLQAMDRVHRLGQQKTVMVYRILTRGTIEERLMSLQRFKLHIASSIITQQNASVSTMNSEQLVDLLAQERTQ